MLQDSGLEIRNFGFDDSDNLDGVDLDNGKVLHNVQNLFKDTVIFSMVCQSIVNVLSFGLNPNLPNENAYTINLIVEHSSRIYFSEGRSVNNTIKESHENSIKLSNQKITFGPASISIKRDSTNDVTDELEDNVGDRFKSLEGYESFSSDSLDEEMVEGDELPSVDMAPKRPLDTKNNSNKRSETGENIKLDRKELGLTSNTDLLQMNGNFVSW